MGLDMYLYAKRYLFTDNDRKAVPKIAKALQIPAGFELKEFKIEAGYWRKANQVHRWFVEHVQDGTDDCGYYYVQKHDLMELRKLCQEILDDRSKVTMLPTTSGFFFGNESYDEWYFDQLQSTVEIIDKALTLDDFWDFEYHSSW